MNQNKKKGGKGISGPKSKKSRVTLPLFPTEDSGDEMPVATTRSSLRHDKKQGKSSKTATKPASPPPADITSEGNDDDNFADGGNDSDQGEVLDSDDPSPERISRKRKRQILPAASSSESDSSDDDIHELASKHLGKLTGALPDYDTYSYGESITTPINTQIPIKIQRKIWENKYLDLAVLLPNTTYSNLNANRRFSLEISHNSKISLVPNTQTKKIINIEQWTTAFLRFAAIYGLKFPKEMSKLMKYAEIVRDLANRKPGLSWLMYDIQFAVFANHNA